MDTDKLVDHVQTDYLPHSVLIDCTASQAVADRYAEWLKRGIHVITPNKRAHSGPIAYYQDLKRLSSSSRTHFLYEATVGAGLPVVHTLKDLVETGDEIRSISGIFSGTLAYLFNVFDGTRPFSDIVRDAKARGYTEPDPRDDLSGMDVARKAVILAREAGLDARARGHRGREPRAGGARQSVGRRVHEAPAGFRRADGRTCGGREEGRQGVALRREHRRGRARLPRWGSRRSRRAIRSRTSA